MSRTRQMFPLEQHHPGPALKAPLIKDAAGPLVNRARQEDWTFETYLARVLKQEVLAHETRGGRVRAARLPAVTTLDASTSPSQRLVKQQVVLVDRLVHHAEIINLKGDSYRGKHREEATTTD